MSSSLKCMKTVIRQRSDYNSPLLQYANQNRNKGYFDDITIGAGQSTFKANRMVLSCYSTFFEEKLKVNERFHKSVSIEDIGEDSVSAIIDFIYSGEITIDQDNVINLLDASHKLKVVELKQFCFEYLESSVKSDNCFCILDVANLYQNMSLKTKMFLQMSQNSDSVIQSLEFKRLSKQNIVDFFSTLNENKFGNMTLQYEAIVTWTKHNEAERKMEFPELFHLLKLDKIPRDFLASVVSKEPLVHKNDACAKLVMEKFAQFFQEKDLKYNKSSIICLSGYNTNYKVKEVWNLSGETSKQYPDLPIRLVKTCSLKIDSTVFCIGGDTTDGWSATNQVWQMDLMKDDLQWKEIASMNEKRCSMGATVYQDFLVVSGGYDGNNNLKSAEIFTEHLNQWKVIAPLNQVRRSLALVESSDCLFALGGWNGKDPMSSVEQLCGLDEQWKYIKPMNLPRMFFAAVTCQNKIFAIGGRSTVYTTSTTNSVEMFDHTIQEWTEVKSMNIERRGHSACVIQDKIFVVGGKNKQGKIVKEIECYDVTSNNWTIVAKTIDKWHCHSVVAL